MAVLLVYLGAPGRVMAQECEPGSCSTGDPIILDPQAVLDAGAPISPGEIICAGAAWVPWVDDCWNEFLFSDDVYDFDRIDSFHECRDRIKHFYWNVTLDGQPYYSRHGVIDNDPCWDSALFHEHADAPWWPALDPKFEFREAGVYAISLRVGDAGICADDADSETVTHYVHALIDIDVDTDRDGVVEAEDEIGEDGWSKMENQLRGALMMANYDDDDDDDAIDAISFDDYGEPETANEDNVVNGVNDLLDLARVKIRRSPAGIGEQYSLRYKLWMSRDDLCAVHIFLNPTAGASHWWGGWTTYANDPEDEIEMDITGLLDDDDLEIELGVEALFLKGQKHHRPVSGTDYEFDGEITIKFAVYDELNPSPEFPLCTDVVSLHVAPLLLLPHTQNASEVWMYGSAGPSPDGADDIAGKFGSVSRRGETAEGNQWYQDHVEIGFTSMPLSSMHIAFRMPYLEDPPAQPQPRWPVEKLLAPDFGVYRFRNTVRHDSAGTGDFGGNLEAMPPMPKWPLGRVLVGDTMRHVTTQPSVPDFFTKQGQFIGGISAPQGPIALDAKWLRVRHVDEFVSFLPRSNGGFKVALADPAYARQLLDMGDPARGINNPPPDDAAFFAVGPVAGGTASNATATSDRVWLFDGAANGRIVCISKALIQDGRWVKINDGTSLKTFEFDPSNNGVQINNVQVNISTDTTPKQVRDRLRTAINNAQNFNVTAYADADPLPGNGIVLVNDALGTAGNQSITENVGNGFLIAGMGGGKTNGRDFTTTPTTEWKYARIYSGPGAGQTGVITSRGKGWISVRPGATASTVYHTGTQIAWTGSAFDDAISRLVADNVNPPALIFDGAWTPEPTSSSGYIVATGCRFWARPKVQGPPLDPPYFPALQAVYEIRNDALLWTLNSGAAAKIEASKTLIRAAAVGQDQNLNYALLEDATTADDALNADSNDDFVALPVIYFGESTAGEQVRRAMAFTPNLINGQPKNASLVVLPKQFGPLSGGNDVFEKAAQVILSGAGPQFADDWDSFHRKGGEVHCGTAARRTVFNPNWWEQVP